MSAWLWCQLRCNFSAQLPLAYFLVSFTVSSANCSSDIICHLSSFCHLLTNSSSELQLVCSAASCNSGVIPHISYNLLCSSARTNNAMVCSDTLCDRYWYSVMQMCITTKQAQLNFITWWWTMLQIAYQPLLHLTRDTKLVTNGLDTSTALICATCKHNWVLDVLTLAACGGCWHSQNISWVDDAYPGHPKVSMTASYYDTNLVTHVLWNYSIWAQF